MPDGYCSGNFRGRRKKLKRGAQSAPTDEDPEQVIIGLYRKLAENYFWNPKDLDDTNLETLFDFIAWTDPNVRVRNGKTYHRAQGVPKWL